MNAMAHLPRPAPPKEPALFALPGYAEHTHRIGSGHFVTLVVPDQVNAMMERFLTISGL